MNIRDKRANELEEILGYFIQSQDAQYKLIGNEIIDAMEWHGDQLNAIRNSIGRMDTIIRAARLARTKLRRII